MNKLRYEIGICFVVSAISEVMVYLKQAPEWTHIIAIFGMFLFGLWFVLLDQQGKNGPVQVYLPLWDQTISGDFYQDGYIQRLGFDQAIKEAAREGIATNVNFNKMHQDNTCQTTLDEMKDQYRKGSRIFVMTMSGKVQEISEGFKKWHNSFTTARSKRRAPILIVTVASAPNLADVKSGIVRWYIRSEEESRLLADYLRICGYTCAAAFGVTHTDGTTDSAYGREGVKQFCEEFQDIGGTVQPNMRFFTTAKSAKNEVAKFLTRLNHGCRTGIFVVGYGDMVKNTLQELIGGGYEGCIVCTSTLTDRQWQPSESGWNKDRLKIFTITPRLSNPTDNLTGNDRNVVFFFAKKTLLRVLKMTARNLNTTTFLDKWTDGIDAMPLEPRLEYFKCGDVLVHSHIVSLEEVK
jgi:ABC-type branched-subunit amino acid transport system substrate-binding protein